MLWRALKQDGSRLVHEFILALEVWLLAGGVLGMAEEVGAGPQLI